MTVEEPAPGGPIYSEEELQQQYYAQLQGLQQNYDGQRSQLERQYEELKLKCKDDEQELNRIIAYEQQQYQLLQQQTQQIQQQIYQHFQLLHQENQKRKEEQQNEPESTDSDMKDDKQATVPEAKGDTENCSPAGSEPRACVDVEENEEQAPLVSEQRLQASNEILGENIISAEPEIEAGVSDLETSEYFPNNVTSPVNIQQPAGDVATITELSNVSQAQDSLDMPITSNAIKESEFSVLPVSPDRSPITQNKDTVHPIGQALVNIETLSANLSENPILPVYLSPNPSVNTIENVPQNLPVKLAMNTSVTTVEISSQNLPVDNSEEIPPEGLPKNLPENMVITAEDVAVNGSLNLPACSPVTSVKVTSPKHLPIENSLKNSPGIIPTSSLVDVPMSSVEPEENMVNCKSPAEEILGNNKPTMAQNQFVALLEQDEELRHDLDDMMATSHPSTDLLTHFFSHVQRDGFIDINTLA